MHSSTIPDFQIPSHPKDVVALNQVPRLHIHTGVKLYHIKSIHIHWSRHLNGSSISQGNIWTSGWPRADHVPTSASLSLFGARSSVTLLQYGLGDPGQLLV